MHVYSYRKSTTLFFYDRDNMEELLSFGSVTSVWLCRTIDNRNKLIDEYCLSQLVKSHSIDLSPLCYDVEL